MKTSLLTAFFLSFFNQAFSMDELQNDPGFGQNMKNLSPQRRAFLPIPRQEPLIFAPIIPVAQRIQKAWLEEGCEENESSETSKFLKKSN